MAARTVFAISIAIVSGPTPPGTGVYAPETAYAAGCTSPISVEPFARNNSSRRVLPLKEAVELLARRQAVDADIQHRRARLHHVRRYESRTADRRNQDVRAAADRRQVARLRVADRHRRILGQQQHRRRLAHDVAAADDHRILSRDRQIAALQYLDQTRRRARRQRRLPGLQPPNIHRMKAVHILLRSHRLQQPLRIHLRRQRKLYQNAVDIVAAVQLGHQREHLFRRDRFGRRDQVAAQAQFCAGAHLAAHINLRRRHMPHQHRGQPGLDALRRQRLHLACYFFLDRRCDRRAIQLACLCHAPPVKSPRIPPRMPREIRCFYGNCRDRMSRAGSTLWSRCRNRSSTTPRSRLLACPVCHAALTLIRLRHAVLCTGCGRRYPIRDGLPILLASAAERTSISPLVSAQENCAR